MVWRLVASRMHTTAGSQEKPSQIEGNPVTVRATMTESNHASVRATLSQ